MLHTKHKSMSLTSMTTQQRRHRFLIFSHRQNPNVPIQFQAAQIFTKHAWFLPTVDQNQNMTRAFMNGVQPRMVSTLDQQWVDQAPRETKVDVAKCHAYHAKCRGVTGDQGAPSAPPEPAQMDVAKCNACRRPMLPSAMKRATRSHHKCHACHAKGRQVPHLPRETKVHVAKCHACFACHAKCRGVTGDQGAPSAPPEPAQVDVVKCHACHAKRRWMPPSATPATRNEGRCRQAPRLPGHACHAKCRGVTGDQGVPSPPPEPAQCHKFHACHAKRRWMK